MATPPAAAGPAFDPTPEALVITKKPFVTWSPAEIGIFLKDLGFSAGIIKSFVSERIAGYHLPVITGDELRRACGMKRACDRLSLLAVIEEMKMNRQIFDPDTQLVACVRRSLDLSSAQTQFFPIHDQISPEEKNLVVQKKVLEKIGGSLPASMDQEEFKDYCSNLCSRVKLQETYLNKDFDGIKRLLSMIPSRSDSGLGFSSVSGTGLLEVPAVGEEGAMTEITSNTPEVIEREERRGQYRRLRKQDARISVKLVITEIAHEAKKKLFRRVVSPLMWGFNMKYKQEFGMFHSALIVGPWYLEWNNSSLCIPRRCYSKAAVIAADLRRLHTGSLDEVIGKISDVIIEWNVNRKYHRTEANCQHFVDDLLQALNISLRFGGSLGVFLDRLRKRGSCDLKWMPSDHALSNYKCLRRAVKRGAIQFKSHSAIDELVRAMIAEVPTTWEDRQLIPDMELIKSFDRAFWLKHFHCASRGYEDEKFSPSECPFGDPQNRSMIPDWFG